MGTRRVWGRSHPARPGGIGSGTGYRGAVASFDDDLRLAHVLADSVERTATDLFGAPDQQVTVADDGSLTTSVATRLEELLRHQLQRTRPRDRVEGRLLEATGHGDRRWVIDALDGSANYVRGVPVWATLISLVVEDEPVLGLVAAPSLARRWWAGNGSGAWTGRTLARATQVAVSTTSVLEHASASADDVASWLFGPHGQGFAQLSDRMWRTRAFGDFWSHALVAEGAADVALGVHMDAYQLATLAALIREAGGRISTPWGAPVTGPGAPAATPAVVTNGVLHDEVLAVLVPQDDGLGAPAPAETGRRPHDVDVTGLDGPRHDGPAPDVSDPGAPAPDPADPSGDGVGPRPTDEEDRRGPQPQG